MVGKTEWDRPESKRLGHRHHCRGARMDTDHPWTDHCSLLCQDDPWYLPNLSAYVIAAFPLSHTGRALRNSWEDPSFIWSYLASEGYIAYQQSINKNPFHWSLDNGLFYEFIPTTTHNIWYEGNLLPGPKSSHCWSWERKGICLAAFQLRGRLAIPQSVYTQVLAGKHVKSSWRAGPNIFSACVVNIFHRTIWTGQLKCFRDEFNIKISEFTVTVSATGVCSPQMVPWHGWCDWSGPCCFKTGWVPCRINDDYRVERSEAIREVYAEVYLCSCFMTGWNWKVKKGCF